MDVTATVILGKLPNYSRWKFEVSAVSQNVFLQQYILRRPKQRLVMESVFQSAAKNFGNNRLSVDIPKKLWGCVHEYSAAFFMGLPACKSSVQTEEFKHTVRFIQLCFFLCTDHNNYGTVTLHASEVQLEPMTRIEIEHEITECDIRRSIIDFGMCSISGSIAGFSWRNSRSATYAHCLSTFVLRCANCSHEVGKACLLCTAELHNFLFLWKVLFQQQQSFRNQFQNEF